MAAWQGDGTLTCSLLVDGEGQKQNKGKAQKLALMNRGNPLTGWPSQSVPILVQSPICTFEDKRSAESQVTKIPISAILLSLHSHMQDHWQRCLTKRL